MGLTIPALANLTYASKLKVVAHAQLEQGTRKEQISQHPQCPLLQSLPSVPLVLPWGWMEVLDEGSGPIVPPLYSQIWSGYCL